MSDEASNGTYRLLKEEIKGIPSGLAAVIESVAQAAVDISVELKSISTDYTGTPNEFGDAQLMADVRADEIIYNRLIESGCVESAPSEEYPKDRKAQGQGYCVAFDPVDGSGVFKSNFAVGTILGIWRGTSPVGQSGRDLAASVYAIYGPKTIFVVARPVSEDDKTLKVQQFVLVNGAWCLTRDDIRIEEKKICSPANFRATTDSPQYRALVQHWMEQNFALRYTGAMVVDVHNILTSGGGIYCFPSSPKSPGRLRLIYEVAPLALIVEAAGGAACSEDVRSLDVMAAAFDDRASLYIGSKALVAECQARFKESK